MKLLYFSQSVFPSKSANSVHIMKMCSAFQGNNVDTTLVNFRHGQVSSDIKSDQEIFEFYNLRHWFQLISITPLGFGVGKFGYLMSLLFNVHKAFVSIRKIKPDVVIGRSLLPCIVSALLKKPTLYESHYPLWESVIERIAFNFLINRKSFRYLKMVVITDALKQVYMDKYDCLSEGNIAVIADAADIPKHIMDVELLSNRLNTLQVGYIGHLYKGKGMEIIGEVAKKMPEIDFHIVGGMDDDIAQWQEIYSLDNLYFHGHVDQKKVQDYIKKMDVCLLPNQQQIYTFGATKKKKNISQYTSPLKMFEYMANGKAIVASDLPVLREVLSEETAVLVQHDSVEKWIAAITMLQDSNRREKLGKSAEDMFLANYTWDIRAKKMLSMWANQSL